MPKETNPKDLDIGYLAGLVDAEGYIITSYKRLMGHTYPGLRVYGTSKPIISGACKILDVNPSPRHDKGKLVGWIAAVQGKKAIEALSRIHPHLADPSKRARALKILESFKDRVSINGKHSSSEFFSDCPPPTRSRVARIDQSAAVTESTPPTPKVDQRFKQTGRTGNPLTLSLVDRGWLAGMIDGEGYVHIRYRSDRDSMYPRLRLFVKSRPIIEKAARLMRVNPYARRHREELDGWYASVSHLKALKVLELIRGDLLDESKKCRAEKILMKFGGVGTMPSRIDSTEFFRTCPPPSKPRKSGRIINAPIQVSNSEMGKPGHPGGLIRTSR